MLIIAVLAGIIPMVIYAAFLFWLDRHEREPLVLVVSVFIWGFIPAALLSLISQLIFSFPFLIVDPSGTSADLFGIVIAAPVTEEIFKGAAILLIYLLIKDEFDSVFDGILYGGIVGFGFAAIENILYFAGTAGPDLGVLIFMRAFIFGLNHAFYTSLTGIGFGIARHAAVPAVRWGAPIAGLLASIAAHMFHNGSLVLGGNAPIILLVTIIGDYIGIFGVLLVIVIALRRERRWIELNLRDEVPHTLPQSVYNVIARPLPRFLMRLSALGRGGPAGWWYTGRYFDALVDLAYKKQLHARRGEAMVTTAKLEALRARATQVYPRVQALLTD
jgi:RsiW-degrading membrane proteinase PrsW (M82 family)